MSITAAELILPTNWLLAALPRKDRERLRLKSKQVPLNFGTILYEPGDTIRKIYFPTSGVVSLLSAAGERSTVEVGLVGKEGIVGLPVFLGVKTSQNLAVVQGEGSALSLTPSALAAECELGGSLPHLLLRYAHSLLTQVGQAAACNRYHSLDARLARWLLMTHDRVETNEFKVTQEFLSDMLGVRREGVNKAAGSLQRRKLIRYSRGSLTILNRTGLEAVACLCYKLIRDEQSNVVSSSVRQ
ncbi:MAG: Crp/Fnr family transcriptional regulator [Acidobacteriota bacterium]